MNNKDRQITGALLAHGDWFVQVLQGDLDEMRDAARAAAHTV